VSNKTAEQVSHAIIKRLTPMRDRVKTITFDNGKLLAHYRVIDQALGP
jgi:IS30 family transposase